MKILIQPTEFIRDEFGADVTLIYGDMREDRPVLYSLKPLNGYGRDGDIYVKSLDVKDHLTKRNLEHLELDMAYPFPIEQIYWKNLGGTFVRKKRRRLKPVKFEREVLGVTDSYAFVRSSDFFKCIQPKGYEFLKKEAPFELICPSDITMAHEGAHLGFAPHKNYIIPRFGGILPDAEKEERSDAIDEAVAIFQELKYAELFHPEFLASYHTSRSDPRQKWKHAAGYKIATNERNAVTEMVVMTREMNASAEKD